MRCGIVKDLAEKHGAGKGKVLLRKILKHLWDNSSSFIKDTKWKPKYNIYGIIENVIINYLRVKINESRKDTIGEYIYYYSTKFP